MSHPLKSENDGLVPQWRFVPIPDNVVSPEVTQRDQFSSENTGLYESLVREATQNSTDQLALDEKSVHLSFSFSTFEGEKAGAWRDLTRDLRPHCLACKMDISDFDRDPVRVLAVEDFNTTGLTGATDKHDGGNFAGFWRKHGGSNKGEGKGGSHGLGKLVFSAASNIGAIYGLTVRKDGVPLLMGQAVLNNHQISDTSKRLPAHGFWTETLETGQEIQAPTSDSEIISKITKLAGFKRRSERGLSIAVPFLHESVTAERITEALLTNYSFQIIAGTLTVDVNGDRIDKNNFFEKVENHPTLKEADQARLQFVERLIEVRANNPQFSTSTPPGRSRLQSVFFSDETLEGMRDVFNSGGIVGVRMPVPVMDNNGKLDDSYVDLYLAQKAQSAPPWALYVRESLVISEETRSSFREPAYGAVIASDPKIAALLRDSENPAHTRWLSNSEKLVRGWKNGPATVQNVKLAPKALFQILTSDQVEDLPDLLINFLSLPEVGRKKRSKKRTPPKPPKPIPKRKRFLNEVAIAGGFRLSPGLGAPDYEYPRTVIVEVAYDILAGDPIKNYNVLDFNLAQNRKFPLETKNIKMLSRDKNRLTLEFETEDFKLELKGFDARRDLIVKYKVKS